jgi:hypothetical protein
METIDLTAVTTDRLEQVLLAGKATVARVRATQIQVLTELDERQVPIGDGSRNLAEWLAARLDVAPETARQLTQTAVRLTDQPDLAQQLEEGQVSFDRVVEETRLVATGANPKLIAASRGFDIPGLRKIVARHQRITRQDEHQTFQERFFSIQPSLDQTSYRMWGLFPGLDGQLGEFAVPPPIPITRQGLSVSLDLVLGRCRPRALGDGAHRPPPIPRRTRNPETFTEPGDGHVGVPPRRFELLEAW